LKGQITLKNKTILITGSEGFTGKVLLTLLKNKDTKVVCTGLSDRVDKLYYQCNLAHEKAVMTMIEEIKPDEIYHLAGSFSNDFNIDLESNLIATKNILESVYKITKKTRVLIVGSSAEYGQIENGDSPISELHALNPASVYGLTKIFQTYLMRLYVELHGLDVVMARVFNLYGKGISEKLFIGSLYKQIKDFKGNKIKEILLGNTNNERDYISVKRAVIAYKKIMKTGATGEVYNVGSGKPVKIERILSQILKNEGIQENVVKTNSKNNTSYDVKTIFANIEKINKLGE
jgi:GDP-4-dehydro-6-deoxy-D-mannose reductase